MIDQLRKLLTTLSLRQQVTIVVVVGLVGLGIYSLAHWRTESDFRPLYTELAPEDASAIIQRLKEAGIEYRLGEGGGTVLVASAQLSETRLEMASAGLPATGRIGFELFDKTNLGITDFTEHVNYRRALEGELERSMTALTGVERARIHVTFLKDSVFLEARQAAKASVMLKLRPGVHLTPQNIAAICHLVASAVEGLSADAVSVLDMRGNLLNRPHKAPVLDGSQPTEGVLEFRKNIESDLLAKMNATLEPLLGANKFRAGASVECDFTSGEQSEETYDPSQSVMVSAQKTEEVTGAGGSGGVPGTATNLPRPAPTVQLAGNGPSRRTENIVYQSSRTVKHTRLPQGTLKRLSLSVLVDQDVVWKGEGSEMKRVLVPPPPERLEAIRSLVSAATGLNPERGDQLIVETLPFETTLNAEPPGSGGAPLPVGTTPEKPLPGFPSWLNELAKKLGLPVLLAIAAATLLLPVCALIFLMMRRKKRSSGEVSLPPSLPAAAGDEAAAAAKVNVELQLKDHANMRQQLEAEVMKSLKAPSVTTQKSEVLAKHVREVMDKDASVGSHVLRSWVNEESR